MKTKNICAAVILFILFLFLTSFKEGLLQVNHAIDVSAILQDKIPSSTKINMISMIGINEPEDPLFYNLMIDNSVNPDIKVEKLNAMIEKYFNPVKK